MVVIVIPISLGIYFFILIYKAVAQCLIVKVTVSQLRKHL